MTTLAINQILIGDSAAMVRLRDLVARLAPARVPVLIQGPSGVGKELVARALHLASGRRGRFVPFNVAAIPETMLEDALFGHVRGAFSGAVGALSGYLAEADGGTVLLDEIGAMGLEVQAKLLRAVELREFRAVGAHSDRASDFRLVAATNAVVGDLIASGRFREDLAYRVSGTVINVPALGERREDIPKLARHFASELSRATSRGVDLSSGACAVLTAHEWDGNVRQLRSIVEAAAALAHAGTVDASAVREAISLAALLRPPRAREAERRQLRELLESVNWHTARAARELGVHRITVNRRMRALGIEAPDPVRAGARRISTTCDGAAAASPA